MRRWLAILMFGLCALAARAVTYTPYYQSQAVGNDGNNGLTPGTAWKTFHPYNLGSAGITGPAIIYIDGTNAYNGHTSSSYRGTYLNLTGASNADVILTNWGPGHWAITNCLAGDAPALQMKGVNWVRIFGMDVSNCVNQAIYINACTNLEFGFCNISSNAAAPVLTAFDESGNASAPVQLVYFHDCNLSNVLGSLANNCADGDPSSDMIHIGGGINSLDQSGAFIIIRCTVQLFGHAAFEMNGPGNRVTGNTLINYPWQVMTGWNGCTNSYSGTSGWAVTNNIYAGGRILQPSGRCCSNTVLESNLVAYCGWTLDQPGAEHWEQAGNGISRFESIVGASGLGIFVNTEAVTGGSSCGSNAFYHESITACGSNITHYSSGQQTQVPYPTYQAGVGFSGSSNNVFVDCVLWDNFSIISIIGGGQTLAGNVQDWRGNITNVNPLWVSEANSVGTLLPNPVVYPNFALASAASPALSSYVWPGVITSAGTGTTFQSTNAFMFSAGQTACYFTMPGDTIQTQAGQVATILSISGNTVTVSAPLTVTSGMGYDIAGANASGAFAFAYGTALVIQAASLGSGNFAHP